VEVGLQAYYPMDETVASLSFTFPITTFDDRFHSLLPIDRTCQLVKEEFTARANAARA
jgi:hypothetical protein